MTEPELTPSMIAAMPAMMEACETFAECLRREKGSPKYLPGVDRDAIANRIIRRVWLDANVAMRQLAQARVKAALIMAKGGVA